MKKILFTINVTDEQKQHILTSCPDADIVFMNKKDVTQDDVNKAEMVVGNVPDKLLSMTDNVKVLQLESAGCESYLNINQNITLTNASGAYGEAIAEHMMAGVFYFYKKLDKYIDQQKYHVWNNLGLVDCVGEAKVLVVGMGDIGSCFAHKMSALGSEVYGVRKNISKKDNSVKEMFTLENIDTIIPQVDIVALCLPNTDETANCFDEKRLRLMKKSSVLLNVGRGNAINTIGLINCLNDGYFKGVLLDVTSPEPLPMNNPLWNSQRVVITPHVSGNYNMAYTFVQVLKIVIENINNFTQDKPLNNVINRKLGY